MLHRRSADFRSPDQGPYRSENPLREPTCRGARDQSIAPQRSRPEVLGCMPALPFSTRRVAGPISLRSHRESPSQCHGVAVFGRLDTARGACAVGLPIAAQSSDRPRRRHGGSSPAEMSVRSDRHWPSVVACGAKPDISVCPRGHAGKDPWKHACAGLLAQTTLIAIHALRSARALRSSPTENHHPVCHHVAKEGQHQSKNQQFAGQPLPDRARPLSVPTRDSANERHRPCPAAQLGGPGNFALHTTYRSLF